MKIEYGRVWYWLKSLIMQEKQVHHDTWLVDIMNKHYVPAVVDQIKREHEKINPAYQAFLAGLQRAESDVLPERRETMSMEEELAGLGDEYFDVPKKYRKHRPKTFEEIDMKLASGFAHKHARLRANDPLFKEDEKGKQ